MPVAQFFDSRLGAAAVMALAGVAGPPVHASAQQIVPQVVVEGRFNSGEGLTFSGEGRLFMAAERAVWEVNPDGSTHKVVDVSSNLGLAPLGTRDLLMADFGPLVWPQAGPNTDGVIWRITPEGSKTALATGIGDPNAIVMLPDGSLLVSDDFTSFIYRVTRDGRVSVFTDAIPFPNGLALAPDGGTSTWRRYSAGRRGRRRRRASKRSAIRSGACRFAPTRRQVRRKSSSGPEVRAGRTGSPSMPRADSICQLPVPDSCGGSISRRARVSSWPTGCPDWPAWRSVRAYSIVSRSTRCRSAVGGCCGFPSTPAALRYTADAADALQDPVALSAAGGAGGCSPTHRFHES